METPNIQIGTELVSSAVGPALLIYRGLPGSGKTTQAEFLFDRLGRDKSSFLDPDRLDRNSPEYLDFVDRESKSDPEAPTKVYPYRFLLEQALNGLKDEKIVIWNQPFSYLDDLDYTVKKLNDDFGKNFNSIIIEVNTPVEIARERNKKRILSGGHGPDDENFEKFVRRHKSAKSLNYNIITVDGTVDPEHSVIDIMKAIAKK